MFFFQFYACFFDKYIVKYNVDNDGKSLFKIYKGE